MDFDGTEVFLRREVYEDRVREKIEADRVEIERLRGLLAIARAVLPAAGSAVHSERLRERIWKALEQSNPDATTGEASNAD